jgi:hypothetical protein
VTPTESKRLTTGRTIPLSFELVEIFGLTEALVLQQLHFWLTQAGPDSSSGEEYDGAYWIYNSYPEWEREIPRGQAQIKKCVLVLEGLGIIKSRQAAGLDRRKRYTIDYDALADHIAENWDGEPFEICPPVWYKSSDAPDTNHPMDGIKSSRCTGHKSADARGYSVSGVLDTKTPTKTSSKESEPPPAAPPPEKPPSERSSKQKARDEMSNALLRLVFDRGPDEWDTLDRVSQANIRKQTTKSARRPATYARSATGGIRCSG